MNIDVRPNINMRSGIIYRNPKAHVFSKQAYFPSVVFFDSGEMLASFVIGEAFESADSDVYVARSKDMGDTWSAPVRLLKEPKNPLISNYARLARMADGSVVANVVSSHREEHPDEGLANAVNIGFVPTDLRIVSSTDSGNTWQDHAVINPPLIGPSFELCSPLVELSDGRWLWPTSTWRGWDGYCPNGMKMVALVSHDHGNSWPEYFDVMNRSEDNIIFWEGKIIELSRNRLLAVAWAYDEKKGKDLPNQYTISKDGGKSWMPAASTNILGETMSITRLPNGNVLAVYRRMDKPGLWLTVARIDGDQWINDTDIPLWGVQEEGLSSKSANMVTDFNELKFGAPCITILPDKSVYIAFWCYEKMVSNIRWFKLTL
jgi:sialidase-1